MNLRNFYRLSLLVILTVLFSCNTQQKTVDRSENDQPAFVYYYRALSHIEKNDFDSAQVELDSAIALRPEYAQFYYVKGEVYQLQKKPDSAIVQYEKALRYKSHYPEIWKRLGELYMQSGQYAGAVQMWRNLIEENPDSVAFELKLADAYLHNHTPGLALTYVNYYLKHGGLSEEVNRIRGLAYFEQKNYPEAIVHLKRYVKLFPDNFTVQKALGIAGIETGALETGITHLNRALSLRPEDPEIYLYRAKYFVLRKKRSIARDQLELAVQLDSTNTRILLETGKFYLSGADTVLAEQYFRRALKADPDCWECYKYLGIIADEQNRPLDALRYLETYQEHIFVRDADVEQRLTRLRKIKR